MSASDAKRFCRTSIPLSPLLTSADRPVTSMKSTMPLSQIGLYRSSNGSLMAVRSAFRPWSSGAGVDGPPSRCSIPENPPRSSARRKSSSDAFCAAASLLRSAGFNPRKLPTPRFLENSAWTSLTLAAAQFFGEIESISLTAASENGEIETRSAEFDTIAAARRVPASGTRVAEISSS